MAAFLNVCRFTPTAGSTTDWTYSAAVTGYNSPALAGVVNGTVYKYRAESADLTQWEIGEGAYNTGTGVLARTTVLYNSSGTGTATGQSGAGSKINFSAAPTVAIVAVKEDLLSIEEANSFTNAQQAQGRSNIGIQYVPLSCGTLAKSGSNIVLSPLYGNVLTIGGINATIPDAGVSLAPTGLSTSTLYYIYAVQTSGVVTSLEASTTVPVLSTTTGSQGIKIKTGDATRRLVGMVYPTTGPAFTDSAAQRFVRTWLNRTPITTGNTFTANRTTTSTTFVELNSEIRNEFLIWADESYTVIMSGPMYSNSAGTYAIGAFGIDGTTPLTVGGSDVVTYGYGTNAVLPGAAFSASTTLSVGYHYATLLGRTNVGTNTVTFGEGANYRVVVGGLIAN